MKYTNIDIHIDRKDDSYLVVAIIPRSRKKEEVVRQTSFTLPSGLLQDLDHHLRELEARRDDQRRESMQKVQEFGELLFNALFQGKVRTLYDERKKEARGNKSGLRLYLKIIPLELVALPWELLFDARRREFVCLSPNPIIMVVRSLDEVSNTRSLRYTPPLRIFGMNASPRDLPLLSAGSEEEQAVDKALAELKKAHQAELSWHGGKARTLEDLQESKETWHVFHFIGHGIFAKTDEDNIEQGQLAFESPTQTAEFVTSRDFCRLLPSEVRLVFLNGCETGRGNEFVLSSVAYSLAEMGIAAVIGMQFKVSDQAAASFAERFYTKLAAGASVDEAVADARLRLATLKGRFLPLDWASPILYMSSSNSVLFSHANSLSTIQKPTLTVEELPTTQEPSPGNGTCEEIGASVSQGSAGKRILTRWRGFPLWVKIVAVAVVFSLVLSSVLLYYNQPKSVIPLCLVTNLPENGTQAAQGRGIRHGVELALKQSSLPSTTSHRYPLIEFDMDDSSQQNGGNPDPAQGAKNLTNLFQSASCPNPIAIIGPYNSSVAQSEIPLAAKNHILLLSPSNTAPCLTQRDLSVPDCLYDQIHPQDFPSTYARLPGTDIDRGYLSADFLVNAPNPTKGGLGARKIEILGDENIAGTQVAQALIQALRQKGITPIGIDCIKLTDDYNKDHFCSQLSPKTEAFSMDNIGALATKIRDKNPDAVFFGGLNVQGAGLLLKYLRELGLGQASFVGTGGAFIAQAGTFFGGVGSHTANAYAIVAGADPSTFTSGAPAMFSQQYQKEFGMPPEPLSVGGYDAANIVIEAIKGLISKEQPVTKESVVQAVLSGKFTGVTSTSIHFDQNGDNVGQRLYTIYQSQRLPQGMWQWKVVTIQQTG